MSSDKDTLIIFAATYPNLLRAFKMSGCEKRRLYVYGRFDT